MTKFCYNIVMRIDHTLLRLTATAEQIKKLCAEAREFGFAAVCIYPCHVPRATVEHVRLMRETVGPELGVKASGGVKDRQIAEAMVKAIYPRKV